MGEGRLFLRGRRTGAAAPLWEALGSMSTVVAALPTLGLMAVAVALGLYEGLGLEGDIGVAVVRSFGHPLARSPRRVMPSSTSSS